MKTSIAVLVLLVVSVGYVYTQPPPSIPGPETPALPGLPAQPQASAPASAAKERGVNQLLDEIQQVRVQKAELEKREQALIAEVRKLVDQQNERLSKMGLGAPIQPPPAGNLAPSALSPFPTPGAAPPGSLIPTPAKR